MKEEMWVVHLGGVYPSCPMFVHAVNEKCRCNITLLHDKRTERET
jgi:hypothetical protein